jgi:hypothetical protein
VCERNLKGRSVRLVVRGPHRRADEQAGPVVKIRSYVHAIRLPVTVIMQD